VIGFLGSAALVLSVKLPQSTHGEQTGGIYKKTTRGIRIYLGTPRLRGLLALNLAVAAAGAMVIVNTVVIVRGVLDRPENDLALALGCFGGGSMVTALLLPRVLDKVARDRAVMLPAAGLLGLVLLAFAGLTSAGTISWPALLGTWAVLGLGYSAVLTPTGRLLTRSAQEADRPAVFAAQFALSHACWLLTYPLAGWLGAAAGIPLTLAALGAITLLGTIVAAYAWPASDPDVIEHAHPDLPLDHPHLKGDQAHHHAHAFRIDDLHRRWPVGMGTTLRRT
jgi:predicted MFS family arabinose efflux permease